MADTLTRREQVRAVLLTGGYVRADVREVGFGLVALFDAAGNEVRAWQQAITGNLKASACTVERVGQVNVWRLRK